MDIVNLCTKFQTDTTRKSCLKSLNPLLAGPCIDRTPMFDGVGIVKLSLLDQISVFRRDRNM